jgi:hypothetical protein
MIAIQGLGSFLLNPWWIYKLFFLIDSCKCFHPSVSSSGFSLGLPSAVGQVPHLDVLVPSGGDDDWVLVVGREPDAGDPILVAVLLDCVLALGKGVPEIVD